MQSDDIVVPEGMLNAFKTARGHQSFGDFTEEYRNGLKSALRWLKSNQSGPIGPGLDSLRYIAESAAEQLRTAEERELCYRCKQPVEFEDGANTSKCRHYIRFEEREHNIFTQRNEGSSTSFYSCGICGASVQPMDRETHIEWHRRVS